VDVFFYLYLPNPRIHVLPPLAVITLLCLAPREESKKKGEKRGEMRAYRRPSSSFLSKNWLDFLSSLSFLHLMNAFPCFGGVLGPAINLFLVGLDEGLLDLLWAWPIYSINTMVCNGGEYQ
jgi:hypothetical protein